MKEILFQSGSTALSVKMVLGLVLSFLIVLYTIPTVILISKRKNLMDEPGFRSSHTSKIPNLGGIAIVYALTICTPILAYQLFESYRFLFASLIILLYIGVMDDIVVMRAYKKLLAQVIVALMIVVGSDVRIYSLFGIFGIWEINYWVSISLSFFLFIVMINSFNLIDGIDGLAGIYSIICSGFYGLSFFRLGEYNYPLVIFCCVIIGAMLGFLRYNLSKGRKKIFMGDTGSLVIGFLLVFTGICFVNLFAEKTHGIHYHLNSAPVLAIASMILPIVDTLSVIFIRISEGRSPMDADKNHIHHKVLNLGLNHNQATLSIIFVYILILGVTFYLRHLEPNLLLAIVLIMGFGAAFIPNFILKLRASRTS